MTDPTPAPGASPASATGSSARPAADVPAAAPRALGPGGRSVFPLAVDGSVFGWVAGIDDTTEVLDAFAACGGTLIATADHYATGRSEYMIGRWLAGAGIRDSLTVATRIGRHPDAPGLSASAVARAVEGSLERLGTRIDLLAFDGEDPAVPLEESLSAIAPYLADGSVGALGAANHSRRALVEAAALRRELGLPSFSTVIAEYSLMDRRDVELELAPVLDELDLGMLARLPLAAGYLTGVVRHRDDDPGSPLFEAALEHAGRHGETVLAALDAIAREHGTSVGSVALSWVLSHPRVGAAVVRARSAAELTGLFDAAALPLGRAELAHLDRVSL